MKSSPKVKSPKKARRQESPAPRAPDDRRKLSSPAKRSTVPTTSPILGEIDLHLFGEGRHERVYEKLGAHVATCDGAEGVLSQCGPQTLRE